MRGHAIEDAMQHALLHGLEPRLRRLDQARRPERLPAERIGVVLQIGDRSAPVLVQLVGEPVELLEGQTKPCGHIADRLQLRNIQPAQWRCRSDHGRAVRRRSIIGSRFQTPASRATARLRAINLRLAVVIHPAGSTANTKASAPTCRVLRGQTVGCTLPQDRAAWCAE
jgi:hypothetical protein